MRSRSRIGARVLVAAAAAFVLSCANSAPPRPADTVFTNARVYTVSSSQPRAEAVVVRGNRIAYVGDIDTALAFVGGGTEVIDLDAIVSDRPAILLDFTIHDAWLNTRALEAGGITQDAPDPVPGVTYWVRDEEGNRTSRTSLQLEPYEGVDTVGAASVDAALMKEIVLAANAEGLDVITHVDGSQTVRHMIDAIEASREAGRYGERNALHHFFWVHPDDLARTLAMKILVNTTPVFCSDFTEQDELALDLLGRERVESQYCPFEEVVAAGNGVSLSADIPSSLPEMIGPLFSVQGALTRPIPTIRTRSPSRRDGEKSPSSRPCGP